VSRTLFEPVKAASRVHDSVLVSFSGGKDSVITLDLCARHFKTVRAFFMYTVPGLSFQEACLNWYEQKYGIEILRSPHPMLSDFLAAGTLRKEDWACPRISFNEVYSYAREQTGCWWIAAGERIADSIVRRAMMKKSGSIDEKRGRFFPVAYFTKADVVKYIKHHRLKVSAESRFLGHSFRSLMPEEMFLVKKHYPADYEKIQVWFPFVDAAVYKFEQELREVGREDLIGGDDGEE
jgi:phosphoadenosine phosphosulfate reductase